MYFQISLQTTCLRICILTLVAFVCLFSTVRLEMHAQMACLRGCMVKLLAFVRFFSTVCFQMSPQMANSRGCIVTLVAFICFVSTLWALCFCILDVSWHAQSHWLHLFGFLHCRFSNVSTKCLYKRMYSYIGCIFCPFSTVCFQMFPQIVCQRGCVVSLVAYVRLFSTLYYQMSSQPTCLRRWNVTLIASVCLFSNVYFQIGPQSCINPLFVLNFGNAKILTAPDLAIPP